VISRRRPPSYKNRTPVFNVDKPLGTTDRILSSPLNLEESILENELALAYSPGNERYADAIADAICTINPDLPVNRISLDASATQSIHAAVVVVLFDNHFEDEQARVRWVAELNANRATTPLLPISLDRNRRRPPCPIDGLKSRSWPEDQEDILASISACLGLALRPGKNKVFVSYREADGKRSAELVENALSKNGFVTWRDESKSKFDEPNLPLGAEVQDEIAEHLSSASAMVLIDTPRAEESQWVRLEVEIAVGKMIPIFPIVLHDASIDTAVSRFRIIESLHRRAVVQSEYVGDNLVLPESELPRIVLQIEKYLQRVYQNRVVHLRELERFLVSRNWSFSRNDQLPHLHSGRVRQATRMLSLLACCSFEDQVFAPRLRKFVDGMAELAGLRQMFNCNYYLYPGKTLPDRDLFEILQREVPELRNLNAELISYNDAVARIALASEGFGV